VFRKLDLFPSSGDRGKTPAQLGPLERAVVNVTGVVQSLRLALSKGPNWFKPGSSHVGFVVDKVTLGQVFSEYFGFPCQFSFHESLRAHPSSRTITIGQLVADVPSGLSLTSRQKTKQKKTNSVDIFS
jgi:hypothetical protein